MPHTDLYLRYLEELDQRRRKERRLLALFAAVAIGAAVLILFALGAAP